MEMSRDVWRSSPNVISHLEMEAEKHRLDDETRKEKVRKLKVRLHFNELRLALFRYILDCTLNIVSKLKKSQTLSS